MSFKVQLIHSNHKVKTAKLLQSPKMNFQRIAFLPPRGKPWLGEEFLIKQKAVPVQGNGDVFYQAEDSTVSASAVGTYQNKLIIDVRDVAERLYGTEKILELRQLALDTIHKANIRNNYLDRNYFMSDPRELFLIGVYPHGYYKEKEKQLFPKWLASALRVTKGKEEYIFIFARNPLDKESVWWPQQLASVSEVERELLLKTLGPKMLSLDFTTDRGEAPFKKV